VYLRPLGNVVYVLPPLGISTPQLERCYQALESALEALQQARSLIPNDPLVHFNLGLTLRRLGRYDESIDAFLKAAELAPDGTG
jgi:tetratricopeptide (TPR) repeat protein